MKNTPFAGMLAAIGLAVFTSSSTAQGTAFSYQGRLNANGLAASGTYDFRFRLAADPLGNTYVGSAYFTNAIGVTNGLFFTTLDFGAGAFNGSNYWLEVDVRTNGGGGYTALSPLQTLTPAPYAVFATGASNLLGPLPAAQISGTVANGNLPPSPTVSGVVTAAGFSGNGAAITNVNATALNGLNAANFWQLGGNNVLPGQRLGSTNNQPVEIWQNNQRVYQASYVSNQYNGYSPDLLGGLAGNYISNNVVGATIGGGGSTNQWIYTPGGLGYASLLRYGTNSVTADFGTVPGGFGNLVTGVGGTASGVYSAAGGVGATALGLFSVANGNGALAAGYSSVASGGVSLAVGYSCQATNDGAVAIGESTTAGGMTSVALGYGTMALGNYSTALGNEAQALHQGAFVWADSQYAPFSSTANDQFLIRAQGGVGIGTNATPAALEVASASGWPQIQVDQQNADYARIRLHALTNYFWDIAAQNNLNIYSVNYGNVMTLQNNGSVGISVGNPSYYLDVGGRMRLRQEPGGASAGLWFYQTGPAADRAFVGMDGDGYVGLWGSLGTGWGLVMNVTNNRVGIGNTAPTTYLQVVSATCNGSSWINASDRNLKQNFAPVDTAAVLAKVVAMPVQSWDYKAQPDEQHIGPVAQDFHAAFGLNGADDTHIATVDEGGVALAAIQGLNRKLENEAARKDAEIAELKARLERLERSLSARK